MVKVKKLSRELGPVQVLLLLSVVVTMWGEPDRAASSGS